MVAIERENRVLKGVLPKDYNRAGLDKQRLGELIDLVSGIGLGDKETRSNDVLGRVYEYFLSEFASAEGKKGGQFYTPRCSTESATTARSSKQATPATDCAREQAAKKQAKRKQCEKHRARYWKRDYEEKRRRKQMLPRACPRARTRCACV